MIIGREEDVERYRIYLYEIANYINKITMYSPHLYQRDYIYMPKRLGELTSLLEISIFFESYCPLINFCLKGLCEILDMSFEDVHKEFLEGYNHVRKSVPQFESMEARQKYCEKLRKCHKIINGE